MKIKIFGNFRYSFVIALLRYREIFSKRMRPNTISFELFLIGRYSNRFWKIFNFHRKNLPSLSVSFSRRYNCGVLLNNAKRVSRSDAHTVIDRADGWFLPTDGNQSSEVDLSFNFPGKWNCLWRSSFAVELILLNNSVNFR